MKKISFILGLLIFTGITVMSQDEGFRDNDKVQAKMNEYLQKRLGLSRNEAEKFGPVFGRYLLELRKSNREFTDPLIRQQRVAELRIRYRDELFKPILGDQRAMKVFIVEREFYDKVQEVLKNRRERLDDNRPNNKMNRINE